MASSRLDQEYDKRFHEEREQHLLTQTELIECRQEVQQLKARMRSQESRSRRHTKMLHESKRQH